MHAKFEVCSSTRSWDNRGYWKNLGRPWIRPRTLFSQIFNGILFAWTVWIHLPNLKLVALPIPEIIGGTQKIGKSLDTPTLPFLQNFLSACARMDPANTPAKFEVPSFSHSWDNSTCSFGVGLRTPNLREGEAVGGRRWKERWWLPIGSP